MWLKICLKSKTHIDKMQKKNKTKQKKLWCVFSCKNWDGPKKEQETKNQIYIKNKNFINCCNSQYFVLDKAKRYYI